MPKYSYQVKTRQGQTQSGQIEASSKEAAAFLLQKYDVFITSITEEKTAEVYFKKIEIFKGVSKKDLAIFSRQLAVMIESRVPIVQTLLSLAVQTKKESFREKIIKTSQLIEEGKPLSEALASYPEIFNSFFVSLVKSGEATGKISETLYQISAHLEREHETESKIRGAMVYPAFVIVVLAVVMAVVMFGVMPKLSDLLKETVAEPPIFTVLMMNFYGFLASYGWVLLLGFPFVIGGFIYYLKTPKGKQAFDLSSLKMPVIGAFFRKVNISQICENLSTLISSGLSINNALKITGDTVQNAVYKDIVAELEREVSRGEKISSVLAKKPEYFPSFVVQMIRVGEETGKLDKTLMEVVGFYQKEIKATVDNFTALLEPILIIFLGIVVALLAVSVLSPLYGALGSI